MRCFLLVYCLLFFIGPNWGQSTNLAIGQWRTHLPYQAGPFVTQSPTNIYFSTAESILIIDKEEQSIDFLDKVDGLSSTGIKILQYHEPTQILVVIYENSAIDLVYNNGQISTLNQIPNFTNFVGEKSIEEVYIDSDSTILLAANYGLSRFNLNREEFIWTTFTGVPVNNVATWQDQFFLATDEGLYRLPQSSNSPEDFSAWDLLDQEDGFPSLYGSKAIGVFENQLYANLDDNLYVYDGTQLNQIETAPSNMDLAYLLPRGDYLLIGYQCRGGCQGEVRYLSQDGQIRPISSSCVGIPTSIEIDQQGRVWFGDLFRNFRVLSSITSDFCDYLNFNSPYSTENKEIAIYNNEVWLASGGISENFTYRFIDHGVASLIDGQWSIYNRNNNDVFKGPDLSTTDDDLFDFITVAVHPANGKVYAGSFFEGLVEIDGDQFTYYNDENSSLGNAVGDSKRTRVSGLAFDDDNNLWISNHTADSPVSVFTRDGIWKNFKPSCNVGEIHQIDVDGSGYKWMASNSSNVGVIVFDEGDFDDPADDRCRIFTSNNSELPTNQTNCLVADLEGDIWVGTSEGIIIFECGNSAFEAACRGTSRIFNEGGFNEALLNTEDIQTIAVDGANRKWVGSKNGVFVLSADGEEEIAHFTSSNSPLLNDNIIDIAINDLNGEVFIGTDDGLISYRSDATRGERVHSDNVRVFPNPVRPDYQGPIAINGLARDANVKITDISGRLVFETTANGGQAIWEGTDYTGRRVATGIYMVYSADNPRTAGFNQPSSAVAKIVFIK